MQCPRCHRVDRAGSGLCPACGFELGHEISTREPSTDILTDDVPIGPLQDFELRRPIVNRRTQSKRPRPAAARRARRSSSQSRPLSVRRATPDVPKFRQQDSALPLDLARTPATPIDGAVRTSAAAQIKGRPTRLLRRRFAAGLLDAVILGCVNTAVVYLTAKLAGLSLTSADQLPVAPLFCFLLLFDATYLVVLTAFGGQTIGKMAAGLRVEQDGGQAVSVVGALARTASYGLSVAPVGLGFLGLFFRPGRALHDLLADTRVVRVP